MNELPKKFIVNCNSGEETMHVLNLYGKEAPYTGFDCWKYVAVDDCYSENCNIFNGIPDNKQHLPLFKFKQFEQLLLNKTKTYELW